MTPILNPTSCQPTRDELIAELRARLAEMEESDGGRLGAAVADGRRK